MAELRKLKQTRGTLKSTLTRAATFLTFENAQRVNLSQFRERKDKISEKWQQFNDTQSKIEELEEDIVASAEREEFKDAYFDIVSRFEELLIEREFAAAQGQIAAQPQCTERQIHTNNLNCQD